MTALILGTALTNLLIHFCAVASSCQVPRHSPIIAKPLSPSQRSIYPIQPKFVRNYFE